MRSNKIYNQLKNRFKKKDKFDFRQIRSSRFLTALLLVRHWLRWLRVRHSQVARINA